MNDSGSGNAWWALTRMWHDIASELDDTLVREHNLSLSWLEVLRAVATHPQPSRVSNLAAAVTLSPSRVCRVLHALEERRLVVRTSSPSDARATEVRLTDKGRELYLRSDEELAAALRRMLSERLTAKDIQALSAIACRVAGPVEVGSHGR